MEEKTKEKIKWYAKLAKYFWNLLIAIDQMANAILGGDPDETISSRVGKQVHHRGKRGVWKWIAEFLDWVDPDHTKKTIEKDEGKDSILE